MRAWKSSENIYEEEEATISFLRSNENSTNVSIIDVKEIKSNFIHSINIRLLK